jgi:hypothetical protein
MGFCFLFCARSFWGSGALFLGWSSGSVERAWFYAPGGRRRAGALAWKGLVAGAPGVRGLGSLRLFSSAARFRLGAVSNARNGRGRVALAGRPSSRGRARKARRPCPAPGGCARASAATIPGRRPLARLDARATGPTEFTCNCSHGRPIGGAATAVAMHLVVGHRCCAAISDKVTMLQQMK